MSTADISKVERRRLADEFKNRKVARGIFAIRCAKDNSIWVGSAPNLDAVRNSLWFQLRGGLSRHASVQAAWNQHGEQAFSLEILERFDHEVSPLLLNQLYTERKAEWTRRLSAEAL